MKGKGEMLLSKAKRIRLSQKRNLRARLTFFRASKVFEFRIQAFLDIRAYDLKSDIAFTILACWMSFHLHSSSLSSTASERHSSHDLYWSSFHEMKMCDNSSGVVNQRKEGRTFTVDVIHSFDSDFRTVKRIPYKNGF